MNKKQGNLLIHGPCVTPQGHKHLMCQLSKHPEPKTEWETPPFVRVYITYKHIFKQFCPVKINIYQASFCRTKLNRVTERSLYTALMEMRRLDVARDSVLRPGVIDEVIRGHGLPLGPCMPHLHQRFRDNRFRRSTNYERLMTYLEVNRSSKSTIQSISGSVLRVTD